MNLILVTVASMKAKTARNRIQNVTNPNRPTEFKVKIGTNITTMKSRISYFKANFYTFSHTVRPTTGHNHAKWIRKNNLITKVETTTDHAKVGIT